VFLISWFRHAFGESAAYCLYITPYLLMSSFYFLEFILFCYTVIQRLRRHRQTTASKQVYFLCCF